MLQSKFLNKVKSFFNETHKLKTKDICLIGVLLALGIVLSSFLQFRLIGDIKVDLSYLVIVIICYLYGGLIGSISAALIALLESTLFGAYGISISWTCANLVIGAIIGTVLHLNYKLKVKPVIDITAIIIGCAIGLLLVKTLIECKLYNIPFAVKIIKNAVAFGVDCGCMIVGYLAFLPKVLKEVKIKSVVKQDVQDE